MVYTWQPRAHIPPIPWHGILPRLGHIYTAPNTVNSQYTVLITNVFEDIVISGVPDTLTRARPRWHESGVYSAPCRSPRRKSIFY